MYKGNIPFGKDNTDPDAGRKPYGVEVGKPLVYVDKWTIDSGWVEMRPNEVVDDKLVFSGFERGRSAARAVFFSEYYGCPVQMFLTDFSGLIEKMVKGKVEGRFAFCKRGQNYGYKLETD